MKDKPPEIRHPVSDSALQSAAPSSAEPSGMAPPGRGKELRRRRWLLGIFASLVILVPLSWYAWRWFSTTSPVPPEVSLEGVEPAVAEAITEALDEVREKPGSASAWGELGLLLRAHGYNDESNVCFAHAERFAPNNPRWPYLQGLRFLATDPEAALPMLQRAVELCAIADPRNTAPELQLGDLLLHMGRIQEAEAHFRRVLNKEPQNAHAHYSLGLSAYARNDLKISLAHLKRASTSPFTRKKAGAQIAAVYLRMGQKKVAAEFSRRADRLPKDLLWADPYVMEYLELEKGRQSRFLRVEELEAKGRQIEITPLLRAMAAEHPDDRSYVALGMNLAKMGHFEEAERVLRTAIRLAPEKVQAHYFLSVALYYQAERLWKDHPEQRAQARDQFRAAAASALKTTALKPDHGYAYIFQGLALKYLDRHGAAIHCFRTALACRPEFVDSHFYLGEALAEAGQVDEARVHLKNAARLAGKDDPRPGKALARLDKSN